MCLRPVTDMQTYVLRSVCTEFFFCDWMSTIEFTMTLTIISL